MEQEDKEYYSKLGLDKIKLIAIISLSSVLLYAYYWYCTYLDRVIPKYSFQIVIVSLTLLVTSFSVARRFLVELASDLTNQIPRKFILTLGICLGLIAFPILIAIHGILFVTSILTGFLCFFTGNYLFSFWISSGAVIILWGLLSESLPMARKILLTISDWYRVPTT